MSTPLRNSVCFSSKLLTGLNDELLHGFSSLRKPFAGTWQEYCVAPLEHLYAIPDSLSDQQAAMFWSNPVSLFTV